MSTQQSWTIGIDAGSTAIKIALYNGQDFFCGQRPSGWSPRQEAQEMLDKAVKEQVAAPSEAEKTIKAIYATGYGRVSLHFANKAMTEIACHGKGAAYLAKEALALEKSLIIDIGGQDAKGIVINNQGRVLDFVMNDKCAAGTGRFLQVTAQALGLEVTDLSTIAEEGTDRAHPINAMCTVFAESEVIGLLHKGISRQAIVAGLHQSIARRVVAMVARLLPREESPILFTGGVSCNQSIAKAIEAELQRPVIVPSQATYAGAIGAALYAWEDQKGDSRT
ncbi:acyl-CoA dehydratase activase [Heliorestis convoluta]|uniref:2-hydroxyglutaryl-CoA dehydratase n=1 Tax=Heliorestis convoluta TaxID=356322 RepID=A0A5Q2N174_9FIRM|nr:acyl-CoA dehydratase activase [Heliorestis convoluta]QGG47042.1 2-hydroxyglutaryl-CoA dehydratase [Heliorestis convoluta]